VTEGNGNSIQRKETSSRSSWPLTAHMKQQAYSIRNFAADLIATLDQFGGNMAQAYDKAMPVVVKLLAQADLMDLGVQREGNHTPSSKWLYYDYELEVHLSTFVPGVAVPIHNHGTWEFIAPVSGEFEYTSFIRTDDGSRPGFAELEIREQRTLRRGEAAVCGPPPNDIHTFTPMTPDVMLLGMNHGPLAPVRSYFDPATKSYRLRDSRAWRLDRA
jgi:predicted metal-dependent enzyme (double-stranded beta helix superfamily)